MAQVALELTVEERGEKDGCPDNIRAIGTTNNSAADA